jgi:HEAT repeat protein
VQLAALRALAERQTIEHIESIVAALVDSGKTNTPMLSDILQKFGVAGIPYLLQVASSSALIEIRVAALTALGGLGSMLAVDGLMALCGDPSLEIRAQAISALGKIGDPRAAGIIAQHLDESEPAIRVQAARALGGMQSLPTLPLLAKKLDDGDWWVRFRSAEALFQFGDPGRAALRAMSSMTSRSGSIARDVLAELEQR